MNRPDRGLIRITRTLHTPLFTMQLTNQSKINKKYSNRVFPLSYLAVQLLLIQGDLLQYVFEDFFV